jgi:hypothetical protein
MYDSTQEQMGLSLLPTLQIELGPQGEGEHGFSIMS